MDEYVRRSYKFAHADAVEVGPVACLPEPPEPKDPTIQKTNRQLLFSPHFLCALLQVETRALAIQKMFNICIMSLLTVW